MMCKPDAMLCRTLRTWRSVLNLSLSMLNTQYTRTPLAKAHTYIRSRSLFSRPDRKTHNAFLFLMMAQSMYSWHFTIATRTASVCCSLLYGEMIIAPHNWKVNWAAVEYCFMLCPVMCYSIMMFCPLEQLGFVLGVPRRFIVVCCCRWQLLNSHAI